VAFVKERFGEAGLLATGAVLGLTDVDALTVSMTRGASTGSGGAGGLGDQIAPGVAALAIAIGILSNTLLKGALAIALGSAAYRRWTALVLGAMCLALGAAALIVRP
jgi:uncharacterized membrane protein (DUF4010 family)